MSKRVLVQILLEGLPKYRSSFLTRLKESNKFDIKVYPAHQSDPGLFDAGEAANAYANDIVSPRESSRQYLGGRLSWHSHFRLDPDLEAGDVIVSTGNPRFLNIYPLTFAARRRKLPIVWWCQGWTPEASPITCRIRHWLTKHIPNGVMVYTKKEADAFVDMGFPKDRTFFLNNTIDETLIQLEIDRLNEQELAAFRENNDLTGKKVLLFCSRLTPKTRLGQAIDAVEMLASDHPEVVLIIIGDGELRADAEELVGKRGLDQHVRFLGAVFEEVNLAPWFLSADCLLYPGPIGLSLLHAFAYGLPVITHDNLRNQNPEVAALEPDANGLMFKENDVADLVRVINKTLRDQPFLQRLKNRAYETAHQDYTMAAMVQHFENAVFSMRQ